MPSRGFVLRWYHTCAGEAKGVKSTDVKHATSQRRVEYHGVLRWPVSVSGEQKERILPIVVLIAYSEMFECSRKKKDSVKGGLHAVGLKLQRRTLHMTCIILYSR